MSCKYSHHTNDLYDVSGDIICVYFDLSEQNPCLAHIHIMVIIYTTSDNIIHVYLDQSGQNPCLANIHIKLMICTKCLEA